MGIRFNIGSKIGLGFAVLILLTLINFSLTFKTLKESRQINTAITEVYGPSVNALEGLNLLIVRSKELISSWVALPKDDPRKNELKKLLNEEYPVLRHELEEFQTHWDIGQQARLDTVFLLIGGLFDSQREVMTMLATFDDYDEPTTKFLAQEMVFEGEVEEQTKAVLAELAEVIAIQQNNTSRVSDKMIGSFDGLRNTVLISTVFLVLGGILIAFFTIKAIVKPVRKLKKTLLLLGRGMFPAEFISPTNDEIGEMSIAMNSLIKGLKRTTDFSHKIGAGQFLTKFKPLSEEDVLGHALLKMRDELKEAEAILEAKVVARTEEVVRQNEEIQRKTEEIEDKNRNLATLYANVTDSIRYAQRIQNSILPPSELISTHLPESFIFYKPKDIVSGDFYWFEHHGHISHIAAVDCTGHGVPGAFMSIVGYNTLNQIISEQPDLAADEILNELNAGVSSSLRQTHDTGGAKDGMDLALCKIDHKRMKLQFAGAYNPLYHIRDGELQQVKGDKFPIGIFIHEERKQFSCHDLQLKKDDVIYIFSDGYADQFGGPKGKKFMYGQFRELLLSIHRMPMEEQREILESRLREWQGEESQIDDILVIGFRVTK